MLKTPRDLVERNERLYGDLAFLREGERSLSFGAYAASARRLSAALLRRGMLPPDRYAVLAMNCSEYMLLHGMAEVSGLVAVPLNFRLAPPEVLRILTDSSPRVSSGRPGTGSSGASAGSDGHG